MYIAAVYADPFTSDLVTAGQKSWAKMREHLKSKAQDERMVSDLLKELFFEQITEAAKVLTELIQTGKLTGSITEKLDARKREANGFRNVTKDFTIPLIEAFKDHPSAENSLRRTYSPEHLEPIIRLEAMIDARIDKALARLVHLKEYKRFAAACNPPLISADVSTPRELKDISASSPVEPLKKDNLRE
jgi:hypothetical protein